MKKIVVFCFAILMVFALTIPTFAAPGAFVSSPSGNMAPELVNYVAETEGCVATIKITAYSERASLDEAARLELEDAYNQIANPTEDNAYSKAINQLASDKSMNVSQLSVSDLFDISASDCEGHDAHEGFTITLKSETLTNLVGILHFNGSTWDIVDVSELNKEEGTVTFNVDELSPFAFVVGDGTGADVPDDGPNNLWWIIPTVIAAGGAISAAIYFIIKKKRNVGV